MLKIYNTLNRKKEVFKPRTDKRVDLFVCGPTVYDYVHIGNARTYVAFDIIVRYLRTQGNEVFYLQNITDIDDKIIARANTEGTMAKAVAQKFEKAYHEDMEAIGVRSVTKHARATDHIFDIVTQVQKLVAKKSAYMILDDGYYFDLKAFPTYGKLSRRTTEGAEDAVSRIDESTQKRNKGDFCLWKFSRSGEPSWPTKIGEGRPGWHIEDTAITETNFGATYDIHGGARDLIFPHHEAEIAQMESISGISPLARYWAHTGFLTVNGNKMSKSLGNFITIRNFLTTHESAALRMIVASAHYRSPIDYTERIAGQAEEQLRRWREFAGRLATVDKKLPAKAEAAFEKDIKNAENEFYEEMDDDFNTPKALATINTLMRRINPLIDKGKLASAAAGRIEKFLIAVDAIFGFELFRQAAEDIPEEVERLSRLRQEARTQRNWAESDRLREEIQKLGYTVDDTVQGSRVKML
ncbi:MAG: cysteine--tRNA ligase [bacterium]|nr:cysteine--tRNA ligase [bacterium]